MSLTFGSANLDWAAGHNREYLRWLTSQADVLLLQEAKDINVATMIPGWWRSLQDTTSPDRAGSCIAVNTRTVKLHGHGLHLGARPLLGNQHFKMLTRWIAAAHVEDRATGGRTVAISAHFPPMRFRVLQPGQERRLRRRVALTDHVIVGLDANQPVEQLAHRLGLDHYCRPRSIVGVMTDLPVIHDDVRDYGKHIGATDHPAVFVTATLPRLKEKP